MNTKTIGAIALSGALAIVGCVSVENTRTQLSSGNPQEVQKAEDNIFRIATTGKDESGFLQFDKNQQIEYVNLASNNALLLKIIDEAYQGEIVVAAANKIDFTKPGIGMEILTKHKGMLEKVTRATPSTGYDSAANEKMMRASDNKKGKSPMPSTSASFADKVFATLNEAELRQALDMDEISYEQEKQLARRLVETTQDVTTLVSFFDGNLRGRLTDDDREAVVLKLVTLADKISDGKILIKMLKAVDNHSLENYVKNPEQRTKLLSRMTEDDAVKYALEEIDHHSVYSWNENKMFALEDAVLTTKVVKDPQSVVKIVSAMLAKITSYKKHCKDSWTMNWGKEDDKKAATLIKKFPKFDDATVEGLICADDSSWSYFIDTVSPAVAYSVLAGGKAKSCNLELELIKKLSKEKLDAAVYKGAHFVKTRKTIYDLMSAELKKTVDAEKEKAYKAIVEKAKSAEKETFVLDGFYLGMPFDEMLVVFDYLFPKIDVRESFDGEEKDSDCVIYVDGQTSPFCYATRKDKKVYQFNFGKKLLKKWYQYNVQTPMEWAYAYSRDNKIDMKFKLIEKDTTVYEMDMSRSYRVWFHQESYQYKHNSKEYRLTYFGEERDFTFEGGIGGAIIKELAAPRFRYVRGDQGSLRARIERD